MPTAMTNYNNVPLVLAVWLAANDGYDLRKSANIISATGLLKPTKSIVLENRVLSSEVLYTRDVSDLLPARLGHAVHTAAEVAWLYSGPQALKELGYPEKVIEKIRINPDLPSEDPQFDIYIEQRSNKVVGNWVVSGKFDFVEGGRVKDIKTTKTYNWIKGSNDEKYRIQASIYRWLNPEIIKDDYVDILMLFTDWNLMSARADKKYPPSNIQVRTLPLMSMEETDRWVRQRLDNLEQYKDAHQDDMPECTPEELWMEPAKYAYFRDPKAKRASKVFTNSAEAHSHKAKEGVTGSVVIKRMSEPKFCKYCPGRPLCLQAQRYEAEGILK